MEAGEELPEYVAEVKKVGAVRRLNDLVKVKGRKNEGQIEREKGFCFYLFYYLAFLSLSHTGSQSRPH